MMADPLTPCLQSHGSLKPTMLEIVSELCSPGSSTCRHRIVEMCLPMLRVPSRVQGAVEVLWGEWDIGNRGASDGKDPVPHPAGPCSVGALGKSTLTWSRIVVCSLSNWILCVLLARFVQLRAP